MSTSMPTSMCIPLKDERTVASRWSCSDKPGGWVGQICGESLTPLSETRNNKFNSGSGVVQCKIDSTLINNGYFLPALFPQPHYCLGAASVNQMRTLSCGVRQELEFWTFSHMRREINVMTKNIFEHLMYTHCNSNVNSF